MADEKPDYLDTLEAQIIVDEVSNGRPLAQVCRDLKIPLSTIYDRIKANPRFMAAMEAAREAGYEMIAVDCLKIADEDRDDFFDSGKLNKEAIMRAKLRVETRLKLLAKWHPKKYGEKIEIESKNVNVEIPASDDPVLASQVYKQMIGQA